MEKTKGLDISIEHFTKKFKRTKLNVLYITLNTDNNVAKCLDKFIYIYFLDE